MKANGDPLVSVVLPVFNGERHVEDAVSSISAQEYSNLEILVIDDGSTDGTLSILHRLQRSEPRLTIISRENRGLVASLNEGLATATGELIARMDADDIAYPARIRRQVAVMQRRPELAICASNYDLLFDGGPFQRNRVHRQYCSDLWRDENLAALALFFTVFKHPSVMFNRRVLSAEELRYDPTYPHAEDLDLFRRIAKRHPTHVIRDALLAYRTHEGSISARRAGEQRRTHLRIVQENLAELGEAVDIRLMLEPRREPTPELLEEMSAFVAALRKVADQAPPQMQEAYRAGVESVCHLLIFMALDEQGVRFAADFLDRTDNWPLLGWRNRFPLRAFRRAPRLAQAASGLIRQLDDLARGIRSRDVQTVAARMSAAR